MKPLLVLGLFLVACSDRQVIIGSPVVEYRYYATESEEYFIGVSGGKIYEVTADEFKRIDVGDEWDD